MKKNNFAKGFTLIELLVVIAIIGILAGIIYAPFQSARRKARDAKKVSEMKSLTTSLSLYNDSTGYYPASLVDLQSTYGTDIPANSNFTSAVDLNKYNYSTYKDTSGNVIGYHLYTHLEAPNTALSSAAKCQGAGGGASNCIGAIATANATAINGSQIEPANDTFANNFSNSNTIASFINRTQDTDFNCKNYLEYCILDYRGN